MSHVLSISARRKRLLDMQQLADETDPFGYCAIVVTGLWLIAKLMAHRLSPYQRAILAGVTILAGGSIIGLLVFYQQVWLAIALVFVLGLAVGIIARM